MSVINRNAVRDLRPVIERAINEKLEKLGLKASLGRITFIPGQEFRGKLTVQEVRKQPVKLNQRPQVGETWIFGGKRYRIEQDNGMEFIASRPSRARSAVFVMGRGYVAQYRIKAGELIAKGVPA